jgi:LPS-assembly protein
LPVGVRGKASLYLRSITKASANKAVCGRTRANPKQTEMAIRPGFATPGKDRTIACDPRFDPDRCAGSLSQVHRNRERVIKIINFFNVRNEKLSCYITLLSVTSILFSTIISPNVLADTAAQYTGQSIPINLCPLESETATKYIPPRAFSPENRENTEIAADTTQSSSDGSIALDGNVIVERDLLRVIADHADYNKLKNTLKFSGNVHIDTEALSLDAEAGAVSMGTTDEEGSKKGEFTNIKFFIPDSNMKGSADIIRSGDDNRSTLNNAKITSCNLLDPDWLISADKIRLDHKDESGTAKDVVIRFKNVPFMYMPYMAFPITDKRRSGLLFPAVGLSSSNGVTLAVPWYWNIAPNQDAVITPRYLEKRGLELGGDYRYLTKSTKGELHGQYLPNDDITQKERYQVQYLQHSLILPNLSFDMDLQDISDPDYFNDFANNLNISSQTHLNRSATLNYDLNNWHIRALVQDILTIDQTISITNRPYDRLPQLTFAGDSKIANSPLMFTLDTEYVDFRHQDDLKTTGSRLTLRPGLRLPLTGAAWFIDPAVKFSHTQYDVGTEGNSTVPGTSLPIDNLNLPISSIDAGLFFERTLNNDYQQTLEPRLFYLHVPFEDQSNTPLFDTSNPDFTVAQLFRDNRFIGGDRIGDTSQLTLALTSRILNTNTGSEILRASIGQIFYFADRKVSLTGNTVDNSSQSDIVAALDANWGRWRSYINLQWDVVSNNFSQDSYFLHYQSDARHLFNIGYRKRLNDNTIDIEQVDTSFVYAINANYSGIARLNYSLKDRKPLDTIAGIAYDSCCWSLQLLVQQRINNSSTTTIINDDTYDNSILVQFVFKGLGSLSGNKTRSTLEQSIYGYTDVFQ